MAYTTIDNPALFFNTVLYTGDMVDSDGTGHTQSITGVGFQPDWVWHKDRSEAKTHIIVDRVRGVSSYNWMTSNNSGAELTTNTNGAISSIDSDGITVQNGNDSSAKSNNAGKNGNAYVVWNWLAGGSASSNSDGDITSSVSANTTAGFSIVSYTGTGSAATIGHGLGVAPSMLIFKNRDSTDSWNVQHDGLTSYDYYVRLNSTGAQNNDIDVGNSAPTSTVVSVGSHAQQNGNGNDMILYAFAEKKGYSKISSYTGNGNADGTFVYTGFKPAWIMTKRTDSSTGGSWQMYDNKRLGYNVDNNQMKADKTNSEDTSDGLDILSNGFKMRNSGNSYNASGATYIYMAFAEAPFVTAGTKAAGTAR